MDSKEGQVRNKSLSKRFWWILLFVGLGIATLIIASPGKKSSDKKQANSHSTLEDKFTASFLPKSGTAFKYNSPTIVDDKIYIGTSAKLPFDGNPAENFNNIKDNYFYKMDLDLNVVWEYELSKTMVVGAAVLDDTRNIYFLTETFSLNNLVQSDDSDKKMPDKYSVYLTTLKLVSLTNDGKLRWQKIIGEENEIWDHSMLNISIGADNTLYFGHEKFYAYDINGNQKWQYPTDEKVIKRFTSAPIIDKSGDIYFVSPEPISAENEWGTDVIKAYKFSPSGALIWDTQIGNEPKIGEGPTEPGGARVGGEDLQKSDTVTSIPAFGLNEQSIYAITGCTVSKLDTESGELLWFLLPEGATGSFQASPVVDSKDNLYIGTKSNMESTLFAISGAGKQIWKNVIGADLYSSPLLGDDGKVYVGSEGTEKGHYHALDSLTGEYIFGTGVNISDFSLGSAALYKGYAYIGVHENAKEVPKTLFKIKLDANGYEQGSPWPRFHGGNQNIGRTEND